MVGPWVAEFDETQLPQAKAIFKDALALTGFEHLQRYLYHGTDFGLHPAAEYALGYRIVQTYLKRIHKMVIEASLVPPHIILSESRFFDE
ncbi:MAG: hypothetical protein GFH27_549287n243 [Chloroflexi bacterium AL-W]|nr:hypothetical protein [Chloroflexi bacterium AL-N1]NOK66517.1 hypothetical protein [Chloroflexi bacterium AL-N10]NOK71905.1 hypothetical protein [Chloroflexi bacterium AL-N5]NOK81162.1 hypothetical protein [Chloroflexi bacterium AL-W]NOK89435.1 hypothetical protein [Chloroflexi bacterium AL-N15]